MRITNRGRVTIPQEVLRELGLRPGDEVEIVIDAGAARIVLVGLGKRVVEALLGCGEGTLSTDEIMSLTR